MVDKRRDGVREPRAGRPAPARGAGSRRVPRRPASHPGTVWSDLPLFPEPRAPEPIVRGSRPNDSRPLAVRRRTPRVPRRRQEERVSSRAEMERLAADRGADGEIGGRAFPAGPVPAEPGRRLAAGVADLLLLALVDGVVVALTARLLGMPVAAAAGMPWLPLAAFLALLNLASVVTLTALGGQTLGKMAAGVRVVDCDGGPVTTSRALVRTVLSVLSLLAAGLGFVGLFARSRRACHDWLADTRVVRAVHP